MDRLAIVVSIIGGLVVGSVGILFVVSAIVLLGEDIRERMAWRRAEAAAA